MCTFWSLFHFLNSYFGSQFCVYGFVPFFLFCGAGIKLKTSYILGKHSTTELYSQSWYHFSSKGTKPSPLSDPAQLMGVTLAMVILCLWGLLLLNVDREMGLGCHRSLSFQNFGEPCSVFSRWRDSTAQCPAKGGQGSRSLQRGWMCLRFIETKRGVGWLVKSLSPL
jgi:hypothetical protein